MGTIQQQDTWIPAQPNYHWSFPRDHWSHPGYKTEWWYFTGHLTAVGDPARRFGYQFTFFRVGLAPSKPHLASEWAANDLVMGHAAVTDLSSGRHVFCDVLYRATPLLGAFGEPGDSIVAWSRAPAGTSSAWVLRWNGAGFDFDARDDACGLALHLSTSRRKPIVFQGPNGFSRKGEGPMAASLYYSMTRLTTTGTLEIDGEIATVQGESWMDREFGSNQLSEHQVGWDWFSLRLEDGRDLMIYLMRDSSGSVDHAQATLIARDGDAGGLPAGAWTVETRDTWTSPATGAEYPARWLITVPGEKLVLEVVPELPQQENVARFVPGLFYWEGAVQVLNQDGEPTGRGYVELTGYGTNSRPAL